MAACTEPPLAPCESQDRPSLELVPVGVPFGAFEDGAPLVAAIPPQGGAPYSPVRARVSGLDDPQLGVSLTVTGMDADSGELFGELSYDTRLVCANVGDSAGSWLAADVHFRYFEWDLDELDGRTASITMMIEDLDGTRLSATIEGPIEAARAPQTSRSQTDR